MACNQNCEKTKGRLEAFLTYYREGVGTIERHERVHPSVFTSENIEALSDKLLISAGIRDYFDRQIYSTAACMNYTLLTEDEHLHHLAEEADVSPKPKVTISWNTLVRRAKKDWFGATKGVGHFTKEDELDVQG